MTRTVLGIDTGGTFTDFVAITDERVTVHKLPSTPEDPAAAAAEGAALVPLGDDDAVAHGTTVATNALLERRGARTALVTTEGFEDVLEIGRQARRDLYDLAYRAPAPLVPRELRLGLAERVDAAGNVLRAPSPDEIDDIAARVRALEPEAVAISLLFAFLHPEHERMLSEALADAAPFVTTSSEVLPEFREYERTSAVVVNAYVGPLMSGYLDRLRERLGRPMRVMQSSGGAISVDLARRQPVRTVLSGPAGGVIGAAYVAGAAGFDHIITLDMGGTSTDVSLCPGRVQAATGFEVDGLPVGVPVIDIRTVGAGGGSIARLDAGGALRVGPESAGASPGPACYGLGDLPTVTDANLLLGRMAAERFLDGRVAIDPRRSREAIERLAAGMGADSRQAALGIVRIANAVMERALRTVSLERGHDPRDFTLVAFGGAGPQHACELAAGLGIERVLVPRHAGVLSAMGVAIAEVVKDYSRTVMARSSAEMDRLRRARWRSWSSWPAPSSPRASPATRSCAGRWTSATEGNRSSSRSIGRPTARTRRWKRRSTRRTASGSATRTRERRWRSSRRGWRRRSRGSGPTSSPRLPMTGSGGAARRARSGSTRAPSRPPFSTASRSRRATGSTGPRW